MNNIKILEEFANKYRKIEKNHIDYLFSLKEKDIPIQAIENLIQENIKLKKENEKLTYARNWYFEHFTSQACTPEQLHKILRFDYIPKSKVKELGKKYEFAVNGYDSSTADYKHSQNLGRYLACVELLKEEGE